MSAHVPVTRAFLLGGALISLVGLLACLAWGGQQLRGDAAGPVSVVFRYDDYGQRSQESVDQAVIDTFRHHGMSFAIAVIPCPADRFEPVDESGCDESLDASRAARLVAAHRDGTAEIAIHGYSHTDAGHTSGMSEFRGVDPGEQERRIRAALDQVERHTGVRPVTFVPPWDSFDANTQRAVSNAGMRIFSGGVWRDLPTGIDLHVLPNTTYLGDLREAVERLLTLADPGALIVTIFHPWDLRESDQMENLQGEPKAFDLPWLDAQLDWLATQPQVQVTTFEAVAATGLKSGHRRFTAHLDYFHSRTRPLLPPAISGVPATHMHTSKRYAALAVDGWLRLACYTAAVLTAVGGIASLAIGAYRRRFGASWRLPVAAAGLGIGAALWVLFWNGRVGWKDYAVVLVACGAAIGCTLAWLDARRDSASV